MFVFRFYTYSIQSCRISIQFSRETAFSNRNRSKSSPLEPVHFARQRSSLQPSQSENSQPIRSNIESCVPIAVRRVRKNPVPEQAFLAPNSFLLWQNMNLWFHHSPCRAQFQSAFFVICVLHLFSFRFCVDLRINNFITEHLANLAAFFASSRYLSVSAAFARPLFLASGCGPPVKKPRRFLKVFACFLFCCDFII